MLRFLLMRNRQRGFPEAYEDAALLPLALLGLRRSVSARLKKAPAPKIFYIFCQGRTGSALLGSLLSSQPNVFCDGEILNLPIVFPYSYVSKKASLIRKEHYGFRIKVYQLTGKQGIEPSVFLRKAEQRGWTCIYLYRENYIRHALSNIFAEKAGQYHFQVGEERRHSRFSVDPDHILRAARGRVHWCELERKLLTTVPHVSVSYEADLLPSSKHAATVDRLCSHLGAKSATVESPLERSIRDRLRDVIENYSEVESVVSRSEFRDQLHDPRYGD
jgi:hypothetical protein